ncbi:MAG TPA: hypothetical protein VF103_11770, partial [Polyangiaceae bacterium]
LSKGVQVFPPACLERTVSFTSGNGTAAPMAEGGRRCEHRPPFQSRAKDGEWTWEAKPSGLCSCREDPEEIERLKAVGECLLACRNDAVCVRQCDAPAAPG